MRSTQVRPTPSAGTRRRPPLVAGPASIAILLTLLLSVNSGAPFAAASARVRPAGLVCDGAWHLTSSERPRGQSYYLGVAPVSSSLGWAVGESMVGHKSRSLIERWNGAGWKIVAAPPIGRSDLLLGVAAPDAGHAFAVGTFDRRQKRRPLIEQFDGAAWSIATLPPVGRRDARLTGIAALSASDAWAVGSGGRDDTAPLMLHWNGVGWSLVSTPKVRGSLFTEPLSLAAVSPSDVWAVGASYDAQLRYQPLAEHWNGVKWSIVPVPSPGAGYLLMGVTADAGNDAWAVGGSDMGGGPLAEHWDGSSWSIVAVNHPPDFDELQGVTASSAGVFAVGPNQDRPALVERWDGTAFQPMETAPEGPRSKDFGTAGSDGSTAWIAKASFQKGTSHAAAEYLC
jgi:hypothetical protein